MSKTSCIVKIFGSFFKFVFWWIKPPEKSNQSAEVTFLNFPNKPKAAKIKNSLWTKIWIITSHFVPKSRQNLTGIISTTNSSYFTVILTTPIYQSALVSLVLRHRLNFLENSRNWTMKKSKSLDGKISPAKIKIFCSNKISVSSLQSMNQRQEIRNQISKQHLFHSCKHKAQT